MKVSVVMAFPDSQQVLTVEVRPNCSARQAVDQAIAAGLDVQHPGFDVNQAALGVFGLRVADDELLQAGDRVEIYRQLRQDPMELRRQRAASEASRLSTRRK